MLDMPDTTGTMDPGMTGTPAMPDATTLLTAAEAARLLQVSERTVRRWISAGELDGVRVRGPHGPEVRVLKEAVSTYRLLAAPVITGTPDMATVDMPVMPDTRPDKPDKPDTAAAALQAELLERERDRLIVDVEHLRAQLDVRNREIERRDQAEAELRRLLLASQQALQLALERPMLPAASISTNSVEKPRVRWWQLWRRKV